MRLISPPIHLEVSPTRFTFRAGEDVWPLEPTVWIAEGLGKVAGIGATPVPGARPVSLFAAPGEMTTVERSALLTGFLLEALSTIILRYWVKLKPAVEVSGIESLGAMMGGYQRPAFKEALTAAGARVVTFH